MLSGHKRNDRGYNETIPPTKRAKVDVNNDVWPKKHKLETHQYSQLPSIMNPSLHKAVFQSFWNKKKFKSPLIEFTEGVSDINPKQKMFQCVMTLINKQNPSQKIMVTSSNFDSKRKCQVNVYQQFNCNYIPFEVLLNKMEPYSFSCRATVQQIVLKKGDFLESKTKTIVIEPIPLNFSEVDIIKLVNKPNKAAIDIINYIEFERDSDREIYKKVYIEFNDEKNADKYVKILNKKSFHKHNFSATWVQDRDSKQFRKKSFYLKCVGFPIDTTKNRVLQFLYSHNINVKRMSLIFKYSLVSQVFVQFESVGDCVKALKITRNVSYKNKHDTEFKLYPRYSTQSEYDESVEYGSDVKQIYNELVRRSKCIDVGNVSWDTKEEQLMAVFGKCGEVIKLHINHRKDLFAGTAFIEFAKESHSRKAILKLNGYNLNGHRLKILMHLKQTKEDKKELRQWYADKEQEKIQSDKQKRLQTLKNKKQKLKRKRLRRSLNQLQRAREKQ